MSFNGDLMDNSGFDVDIVTGKPLVSLNQEKGRAAEAAHHQTIQDSLQLVAELSQGPTLAILSQLYTERLNELAKQDATCQLIERIITALRYAVDMAPKLAEGRMKQAMGATLAAVYLKSKPAAP